MFAFKMFSDFPPWVLSLLGRKAGVKGKKGESDHKSGRIGRPPRKISTHSLRRVEQFKKQPQKDALNSVRSARRHTYQIKENRGQLKRVAVAPDSSRVMVRGVLPQREGFRDDRFDLEIQGLAEDARKIESKLFWDAEKISAEIHEDLKAEDEGTIGPAEMAQQIEREHSEQFKRFSVRQENFERALKEVSRPDPARALSPRVLEERGLRERKSGWGTSERVLPQAEVGDRNRPKVKDGATVSLQRAWQSRAQKSMFAHLNNRMKNMQDKLNALRSDFGNELHIKKENYVAQAVQDVNMLAEQPAPSVPLDVRQQDDGLEVDKQRKRQEAYFRRQRQLQQINAAPQPKPPKFNSADSARRSKKDDDKST